MNFSKTIILAIGIGVGACSSDKEPSGPSGNAAGATAMGSGGALSTGSGGGGAVTPGLVGHWKLDEADTTGMAKDSSGNNRSGTYSAMKPTVSTMVPAQLGAKSTAALSFNGTSSEVVLQPSATYGTWNATGSYSISAWVLVAAFTTDATWMGVISNEGGAMGTNYCGIYIDANQSFAYEANEIPSPGTTTATLNTWQHVAVVQDGTTNKLYVNGTAAAGTRAAQDCSSTFPFRIGSPDGKGGFFNGRVDDVRFYNKALTQAEVTALSTGQN